MRVFVANVLDTIIEHRYSAVSRSIVALVWGEVIQAYNHWLWCGLRSFLLHHLKADAFAITGTDDRAVNVGAKYADRHPLEHQRCLR